MLKEPKEELERYMCQQIAAIQTANWQYELD